VLKDKASRVKIYAKMREVLGPIGATYKNNTFKKYFLYPTNPVTGIPETNAYDSIVNIMEFVITDALMERLPEMRAEHRNISAKIKTIEKYLPDYEKQIGKNSAA
jgi:hypothetical protein